MRFDNMRKQAVIRSVIFGDKWKNTIGGILIWRCGDHSLE